MQASPLQLFSQQYRAKKAGVEKLGMRGYQKATPLNSRFTVAASHATSGEINAHTHTFAAIFSDVEAFGTHTGHTHHGSRVVHTLSHLPTRELSTAISVTLTKQTIISCINGKQ